MRPEVIALALTSVLSMACEAPAGVGDAGVEASSLEDAPADAADRDAAPPPEPFAAEHPYTQYVDPTTGTGGLTFNDIGSVHPGPQMPFGMIRPGPDTVNSTGAAPSFTHCSGYHSEDEFVSGFSHVRMHGVGINDQNVVAFMPALDFDAATASALGLQSHFDPDREVARPSVYTTVLDDERWGGREVTVEMTAARRAAVSRITFPDGTPADPVDASIVIDLAHTQPDVDVVSGEVRILPESSEVEGRVRFSGGYSGRFGGMDVYFVMRFSRAFVSHGTWAPPTTAGMPGTLSEGETSRTAPDGGAFLRFDVASDQEVRVAVAISYLDVARARLNLDAEASDVDFIRMQGALESTWEELLSRVDLEARFERDLRIFYTALYHSFFMPTLATEDGGHYPGIDEMEHVAAGLNYCTAYTL